MKCRVDMAKICCGLVLLLFLSYTTYSYVYCNGAGSGYEENQNPDPGLQAVCDLSIDMLIVEGAGFYLAAVSDIQSLLRSYELHDLYGTPLSLLREPADRALFNMNYAIYTYERLIRKAEYTPYNQETLAKLAAFDYESYLAANGLNRAWFDEVAIFLKNGDITGIFKETCSKFTALRERLKQVRESLLQYRLPLLSDMWRLQEQCTETSYFGSCAARIFREIR
jgi:hypothetical protein